MEAAELAFPGSQGSWHRGINPSLHPQLCLLLLPLLIYQLEPIRLRKKPRGGPGAWKQEVVNIDLCLTPD